MISFCVRHVKLEVFVLPYIAFINRNELLLLVICGNINNSVLKEFGSQCYLNIHGFIWEDFFKIEILMKSLYVYSAN